MCPASPLALASPRPFSDLELAQRGWAAFESSVAGANWFELECETLWDRLETVEAELKRAARAGSSLSLLAVAALERDRRELREALGFQHSDLYEEVVIRGMRELERERAEAPAAAAETRDFGQAREAAAVTEYRDFGSAAAWASVGTGSNAASTSAAGATGAAGAAGIAASAGTRGGSSEFTRERAASASEAVRLALAAPALAPLAPAASPEEVLVRAFLASGDEARALPGLNSFQRRQVHTFVDELRKREGIDIGHETEGEGYDRVIVLRLHRLR